MLGLLIARQVQTNLKNINKSSKNNMSLKIKIVDDCMLKKKQ
jgi:hypothetical protein